MRNREIFQKVKAHLGTKSAAEALFLQLDVKTLSGDLKLSEAETKELKIFRNGIQRLYAKEMKQQECDSEKNSIKDLFLNSGYDSETADRMAEAALMAKEGYHGV